MFQDDPNGMGLEPLPGPAEGTAAKNT